MNLEKKEDEGQEVDDGAAFYEAPENGGGANEEAVGELESAEENENEEGS